ncbi:protein of unknown function [Pararobbsia alpina]
MPSLCRFLYTAKNRLQSSFLYREQLLVQRARFVHSHGSLLRFNVSKTRRALMLSTSPWGYCH